MDDNSALIAASGQILSTGANIAAQSDINKKTQAWNEKMYALQRENSLADWAMQNEYNHPSEQMARLRKAGLNPALVYGKGADNTAQSVQKNDVKSWNPKAPDMSGIGNSMMAYMDTRVKEAQVDNLREQNTVLVQEAANKAAATANMSIKNARDQFEFDKAKELRSISLDTAKQELAKLTADTTYSMDRNEREAVMNSQSVSESIERVLNLRAQRANTQEERKRILEQIEGVKKDNELKQLDINLKREGIQPSDNVVLRAIAQYFKGSPISSLKEIIKSMFDPFSLRKLPQMDNPNR